MNSLKKEKLKKLLSPKTIAFFGGADVEIAIAEVKRRGFKGPIWPVNPNRNSILGITCFKTIKELPSAPDASFIAVPSKLVISIIKHLSKIGAGGAVCYSAGFGETGIKGKRLEKELTKAAKDMPIIGPNCYGFINYLENVALWPFAHGGQSLGYGAAIITQSGMLSSDITMTQRSLPLTHMISIGNQSSISIENLIEVLQENQNVRAIGIHIEGIKDIRELHNVALKAIKRKLPIVALKTGTSAVGGQLTSTHTGSLSGEDKLYDALFQRTGIIRVGNPIIFVELLKFLCISGVPKDNRLVAFTCSGGGATLIADYCEKVGINLPSFDSKSKNELKDLLPSIATVSNPLDYTTPIWGNESKTLPVFSKAIRASKASIAMLLQDYPADGLNESEESYTTDAKAFIQASVDLNIATVICSTFPENMKKRIQETFALQNVSPMLGIDDTLDAINLACIYNLRRRELKQSPAKPLLIITKYKSKNFLNELDSKSVLKKAGISVPKSQFITYEERHSTEIKLRFPLALKLLSSKILHKTEYGAICLSIDSRKELIKKLEQMHEHLKSISKKQYCDQFIIEEMQPAPIVEMLIGFQSDPQFGYSLLLGAGGVQAEIMNDTVSILLPTNKDEIISSIKKLKLYKLMNGFRANKQVELDVLAFDILQIAALLEAKKNSFTSIEINPLFVYERSTCAIDAVIGIPK